MRCVECDRTTDDALGWRAYLAGEPDDDAGEAVAVYCPECAARGFADAE